MGALLSKIPPDARLFDFLFWQLPAGIPAAYGDLGSGLTESGCQVKDRRAKALRYRIQELKTDG